MGWRIVIEGDYGDDDPDSDAAESKEQNILSASRSMARGCNTTSYSFTGDRIGSHTGISEE